MKINIGTKWGAAVAGAATALAVVVTDGVLDAPDLITVVFALLGSIVTGIAGKQAYENEPKE